MKVHNHVEVNQMEEKILLKLDTSNPAQMQAFQFAQALCHNSNKDNTYLADFWNRMMEHADVFEEFQYYLLHQDYLCLVNVGGYTITDIIIWQLDHFKAELDKDKSALKGNSDYKILNAFDLLLRMKENPAHYIKAMENDTGSDYPGKF